mgnify:CR=1 FL=1
MSLLHDFKDFDKESELIKDKVIYTGIIMSRPLPRVIIQDKLTTRVWAVKVMIEGKPFDKMIVEGTIKTHLKAKDVHANYFLNKEIVVYPYKLKEAKGREYMGFEVSLHEHETVLTPQEDLLKAFNLNIKL